MAALKMLFDLVTLALWVWALARVAKKPAASWVHGWVGKVGSILVVLVVYTTFGGWFLPWGAIIVWRRRLVRRDDDFELPMADGRRNR